MIKQLCDTAPYLQDDLIEKSKWRFFNKAGDQVGQLYRVGVGRKAFCRIHDDCVCWVSRFADPVALEADLIGWLRLGVASPAPSQRDHARAGYDLKVKYGMKPNKVV